MAEIELRCPEGADSEAGANHDGAFRIAWSGPEGTVMQLMESGPAGAKVIYRGAERASTITGRPAGDYRYTVAVAQAGEPGPASAECLVLVRPYSLSLALAFFAVGLAVTVATVVLVLRGHRAHRRGELS